MQKQWLYWIDRNFRLCYSVGRSCDLMNRGIIKQTFPPKIEWDLLNSLVSLPVQKVLSKETFWFLFANTISMYVTDLISSNYSWLFCAFRLRYPMKTWAWVWSTASVRDRSPRFYYPESMEKHRTDHSRPLVLKCRWRRPRDQKKQRLWGRE